MHKSEQPLLAPGGWTQLQIRFVQSLKKMMHKSEENIFAIETLLPQYMSVLLPCHVVALPTVR